MSKGGTEIAAKAISTHLELNAQLEAARIRRVPHQTLPQGQDLADLADDRRSDGHGANRTVAGAFFFGGIDQTGARTDHLMRSFFEPMTLTT
jgi:hypothetical protein